MNDTRIKIIKLIMLIIVIIVLALSSTYAFLYLRQTATATGAQAGCFNVNYSAQEINASSLVSTTNYLEGAKSQVSLSKASDCEIYTEASIYIHTNTTTTAPINTVKALKYKVLDSSNNVIAEENVITTTNGNDLKIATVSLTETAKTYTIYIWVDSDISLGYYNGTTYSGYIYAESIQTSTVK